MDYYLNKTNQIDRLVKEYDKYKKIIVAYDFDNTVYDYHKKGYDFSQVVELLRQCEDLGFYLVVYTCKPKAEHDFIRNYLESNDIPYDAINENAPFINFSTEKLYYNILLDDRAGLSSAYKTLEGLINYIRNGVA